MVTHPNICRFNININKLCVPLAVVSLNDTEELSSGEEDDDEDEEEEEEEDSGSEVEIIEEVKGNGTQQHLYLQDLQPEDQFLQEQAAAVLSLVTDPQLKVRRSSHCCPLPTKLLQLLHTRIHSSSFLFHFIFPPRYVMFACLSFYLFYLFF